MLNIIRSNFRKILNRFKNVISNPWKIIIYLDFKGFLDILPDSIYLKLVYKAKIGKRLNLDNPKTFNEKLQWLKLHDRKRTYSDYADKYKVRDIIRKKFGAKYLIPLYGVYNNPEDIEFSNLPNSFVLKCTHDSGGVIVCKDKKMLDKNATIEKLNSKLNRNFYYNGREWPYKNIKPRIICEKYMEDSKSSDLIDYKFMCFNGKVKCSFIVKERNKKTGMKVDFYDTDWNLMDFKRYYPSSGEPIAKPENYDLMVKFSELLAKEFAFIRVDFYEVDGLLYFGEVTFYPGSGFEKFIPEKYDYLLGSWLDLSEVK